MGSGASTEEGSSNGNSAPIAAVLVCHSTQEPHVRDLLAKHNASHDDPGLQQLDPEDVLIVTESFPRDLTVRAQCLFACETAIVAVDPGFLTAPQLVDALSFLKDSRKAVVAGPLTVFTRPTGAVGAICTAYGRWHADLFESERTLVRLAAATAGRPLRLLQCGQLAEIFASAPSEAELEAIEAEDQAIRSEATNSTDATAESTVLLLSAHGDDDGRRVAECFFGLESQGTKLTGGVWARGSGELPTDLAALARARVVTFVLTPACVGDRRFRRLFEAALRWRTPLLPVNAQVRLWELGGGPGAWLPLAMAGRLWYEVDVGHLEYLHVPYAEVPRCPCKVRDACLATDFLVCANGWLQKTNNNSSESSSTAVPPELVARSREEATITRARERAQVLGLSPQAIEDVVCAAAALAVQIDAGAEPLTALETLGVVTDAEAIDAQVAATSTIPYPPEDELLPAAPTLGFYQQHYEVTRLSFAPPPSVLDALGLPIPGLTLDAMFSYQWGSQETVLDIQQQAQTHNVRAWFDVFGHMQGNVNAAMATAVEHVACVVVFLTTRYVQSVNCQLEFQYAARRHKPVILVFLEDPATVRPLLPTWLTDVTGTELRVHPTITEDVAAAAGSPRVLALDYRAESINGHRVTNVLFGAIRALAAQQSRHAPVPIRLDGSLGLYAVTSALHHAVLVNAAASQQQQQQQQHEGPSFVAPTTTTATQCTRCGAAFDPAIPSSLGGCRKHGAYYVGGSLMAGRWVCCQATATDGPGCQPAEHTAAARNWSRDPSYGTYTWQPE